MDVSPAPYGYSTNMKYKFGARIRELKQPLRRWQTFAYLTKKFTLSTCFFLILFFQIFVHSLSFSSNQRHEMTCSAVEWTTRVIFFSSLNCPYKLNSRSQNKCCKCYELEYPRSAAIRFSGILRGFEQREHLFWRRPNPSWLANLIKLPLMSEWQFTYRFLPRLVDIHE